MEAYTKMDINDEVCDINGAKQKNQREEGGSQIARF
jgi:hypothetical protein